MHLNCKGNLINLNIPKVMGILNITPDSFYDGGTYINESAILSQIEKMLNEGATFIDVGAYSSRPNAEEVTEEQELYRITPIIDSILKEFPDVVLSIDTFRSKIAHNCLEMGASIINDISAGLLDSEMLKTVAKHKVPYIMMHMKGTPQTMQEQTNYKDLTKEMLFYFSKQIALARSFGIMDIVIDPGFGFAKTTKQNYQILQELDLFSTLDLPILVGLSRKSMIYKTLNIEATDALNGSTALHMIALNNGATILKSTRCKRSYRMCALI